MPNVVVHCDLAARALHAWAASSAPPPFSVDEATRNAFLHGAVRPDMGYFPGAHPLVSRLAHHVRPAALVRALVAEARTDVERAFAWGWLTHVLADVAIHPLVNEAAGEQVTGIRQALAPDRAPAAHVGVEVGLDAFYSARTPSLGLIRLVPAFGRSGVRFIVRAYRRAYGAAPSPAAVLAAHRAVCRAAGPLWTLNRAVARINHLRRSGPLPRLVGAGLGMPIALLRAACPRGSYAEGLFTPVPPAEWLVDAVDSVGERFARDFLGHAGTGLRLLTDIDLDTGEPSAPDSARARCTVTELFATAAAGWGTRSRAPSAKPGSTRRIRRPSAAPAA